MACAEKEMMCVGSLQRVKEGEEEEEQEQQGVRDKKKIVLGSGP